MFCMLLIVHFTTQRHDLFSVNSIEFVAYIEGEYPNKGEQDNSKEKPWQLCWRSRDDLGGIIWNTEMLACASAASKHKHRLVVRIRLEIHENWYPLQNKPALKEMAAAPIGEGI